ncbi:MAG: hypothetical protein K0R83_111 [Caulobacter sp.]|jgi:uncharacterized membrane protein|nr:hypothetical protein [Caulobacter sp.]
MSDARDLDEHELDSVETVARLHRKHDETASGLQRAIDAFTDGIARPLAAVVLIVSLLAGVAVAVVQSDGQGDGPVALWLHLAATLTALVLSVLILASQKRSDAFAARRDAMTLDLALLADRKNAKIIELLEGLRRESHGPGASRRDAESEEMSTPIDARALVDAVDRSVEGSPTERSI